jgi:hypothetical protein
MDLLENCSQEHGHERSTSMVIRHAAQNFSVAWPRESAELATAITGSLDFQVWRCVRISFIAALMPVIEATLCVSKLKADILNICYSVKLMHM